jgi:histone H3/H4
MSDEAWRPCSTCKKPIATGARYWQCSVSTCNRARFQLAFCSVACWDAHVPTMNHRNAWCTEHRAPRQAEPVAASPSEPARHNLAGLPTTGRDSAPEPSERRRIVRSEPEPQPESDEVLIVASRLKQFIRDRSEMNMSNDVLHALSEAVRLMTIDAIERAHNDGRKTVMARDFR